MSEAISPQREIVGELFRLTTALATAKTDSQVENNAVRYSFSPIWIYQVPPMEEHIILPEHHVTIKLDDDESSSAEWTDAQQVRVVVWDADLKKMVIIYEGRYGESKDSQDIQKMATFDILKEPLLLKGDDWIYVEGLCNDGTTGLYTIDVSDSFFSLEMLRVRPGIFQSGKGG